MYAGLGHYTRILIWLTVMRRYHPSVLRGTNGNANYFTFKVVAYSYRRGLLLEDDYTFILSSTVKPSKETKLERQKRYSLLMKENGWTRAELSRQLGVSRAWVTMTLG